GTGAPYSGGSWFPNLHMDQQPAFSVKGSIGRLINIEINSEEGFGTNLKEQLKITYKGEGDELEDDIIQEIEAGNTSLALTGTDPLYFKGGQNRRLIQVFQLLLTGEEPNFKDTATACTYDRSGNRMSEVCETGRWKPMKEGADFFYDDQMRMLTVPGGNRNMS